MDTHIFLQLLAITLCAILLVNGESVSDTDPSAVGMDDYELSPVAAEFYRQIRGSYTNSLPYRRLPWNARIRPGMAGGFRKRVSERDISNMLKGTWLG